MSREAAEQLRDQWEVLLELDGYETAVPIIDSAAGATWIWSDLHLSDRGALEAFDRPFADVGPMNAELLRTWSELVGADETIICLGDVAHPDAWRDRRLMERIRGCPGERWLLIGNHDEDRRALEEAGFDRQHALALCATDPPLALSHWPLARVPAGAVNLHGHLHEGTEPTARHINLAVEGIDYRPVRLADVLAEARRRLSAE